jgi:ParB-like nuclease domain
MSHQSQGPGAGDAEPKTNVVSTKLRRSNEEIATEQVIRAGFSWRSVLNIHPAAELFPLASEAELKELADDIEAHGLQTPVVLFGACDDAPCLIDGRNRLDALQALGLLAVDDRGRLEWAGRRDFDGWHLVQWTGRRGDPYDLVLSYNVHRRHLNAEQKRELVAKVLKAKPGVSNVTIAKQVKADDKTVAKVRRDLEATSEIPRLEKTVGADGKSRKPPKKPPTDKRAKSKPALSPKELPKLSASEKALAEIKWGHRHYLPKMTLADRRAALADMVVVANACPAEEVVKPAGSA